MVRLWVWIDHDGTHLVAVVLQLCDLPPGRVEHLEERTRDFDVLTNGLKNGWYLGSFCFYGLYRSFYRLFFFSE